MTIPCIRNPGILKPEGPEHVSVALINSNYEVIDSLIAKNKLNGVVDPAVTNDLADGYSIGSVWINAVDHTIFIAEDVTTGAAVWRQIYPTSAAGIDHGGLTGLSDDDHAQYIKHALATAANDFLIASGAGVFVKKTLAETRTLLASPLKADLTTKGDIWAASAASTPVRLAVGANGLSLVANSAQTQGFSWAELMTEGVYRQAIINSSFQVNQQAVSPYTAATSPTNSDDTYLFDQWILLSDGNDIVDVSQETTVVPTGGSASAKFEVETANKKFGILQIIEKADAIKFAGKTVSLQFKARTTTGKVIENVRAAVLSWSSTADAPTSDVIASWGAEGSNPTFATNWTAENTASNLTLVADTWTTYKIENIAIDTASMANLAVLIWVDDTDAAVDDLLYISDVQLNQGPVCLPYMPISFVKDLWNCYRFWESSYAYGTAPGTPNVGVGFALLVGVAVNSAQYLGRGFRQPKPGPTAITVYSYAGTKDKLTDLVSTDVGTSCISADTNRDTFRKVTDASNPFTVGAFYQAHWVADARL